MSKAWHKPHKPPAAAHFAVGDALRGAAALMVVIYHVAGAILVYHQDGWFRQNYGVIGAYVENFDLSIYVFFALSGYLLARPFVQAIAARDQMPSIRGYLRNRALRILPAFWAAVLVTALLFGFGASSLREILLVPLMLQIYDQSQFANYIGQAWTVDVELGYYLLLPLGAALLLAPIRRLGLAKSHALGLIALLALAVMAGSVYARHAAPASEFYARQIPMMMFSFMPGVLFAVLELIVPPWLQKGRRAKRVQRIVLLTAGYLFLIYGVTPAILPTRRAGMAVVVTSLFVLAALILQWGHQRPWRLLDNRAFHWLGKRSYSFYLFHFLILLLIDGLFTISDKPAIVFAVVFPIQMTLGLFCAWAGYRFIERPFILRQTSWAPQMSARREPPDTPEPERAGGPRPAPEAVPG